MKTTTLILLVLTASLVYSTEINLTSGKNQTQVIELYTSEGCSSCPPADRWLTSLKSSPKLFKDFIPVAFHVDYWDYIGWKDQLASAKNSKRQRFHKLEGNLNSVYTPGILKAGKEWRGWYGSEINVSNNSVGTLSVVIKDNNLKAVFDTQELGEYNLVVALMAMNIETKVQAGENRGKTLRHDFVIIKQQTYRSKNKQWETPLNTAFFETKYKNTALVAWVERSKNPTPIQAVAKFL